MAIDISKYQSKPTEKAKAEKTSVSFSKDEEGYVLLQKLREMGIEGAQLKTLITDLLRDAVTPKEKKGQ